MTRNRVILAVTMLLIASMPSFAASLFTNGGFENGDFTGWTVQQGVNNGGPSFTQSGGYGYWKAPEVITSSKATDTYNYPYIPGIYNGSHMAVLNNAYGMYDATRIFQSDTVNQSVLDDGGVISVNWGVVLDDPSHPSADQPAFQVQIFNNNASVANFFATATDAANPVNGWTNVGSYAYSGDALYYKAGQFQLPVSGFALGDVITVQLSIYDCAYGGHGGYAFLDGIQSGTPPPPPPSVPEPGTFVLVGLGLAGAAIARKVKK
jgi:hypothetical protein